MQPGRDSIEDVAVTRNVLIRLLVTQAERDAMQAAADRAGLTLSEWVRQQCFITTTTVTTVDEAITPPSRARQQRTRVARKAFGAAVKKRGG